MREIDYFFNRILTGQVPISPLKFIERINKIHSKTVSIAATGHPQQEHKFLAKK